MNAADTAWRRPPRPPRPRFLASSILPALTIFLTAILQISASNSLHEHENRNSDLYCNKTLVSTSQCSLRTKIPLCHNGTHASSQLRALTPPGHFSTPLLDTPLPTILYDISFTRLPAANYDFQTGVNAINCYPTVRINITNSHTIPMAGRTPAAILTGDSYNPMSEDSRGHGFRHPHRQACRVRPHRRLSRLPKTVTRLGHGGREDAPRDRRAKIDPSSFPQSGRVYFVVKEPASWYEDGSRSILPMPNATSTCFPSGWPAM